MTNIMPQEIEVWYLLPALRKELARIFIKEHHLTQKDAAALLDITESAISQYVKEKRGTELKFTDKERKKIIETAEKILKDRKHMMEHLYSICIALRGSQTICELHRKYDKGISHECKICME